MFYRISSRRKRKQRKKNQRTMWSKTHQILNRLMFACFLSSRYFWIQFRVFFVFFLVSDHFVQFNALVSMVFFHTAFVSSDFDVSLNEIVCYFSNCLAHHTMINHNVVVQCSQLRQLTYVTSPWIIPPKWLNKEIRCWIIHFFLYRWSENKLEIFPRDLAIKFKNRLKSFSLKPLNRRFHL